MRVVAVRSGRVVGAGALVLALVGCTGRAGDFTDESGTTAVETGDGEGGYVSATAVNPTTVSPTTANPTTASPTTADPTAGPTTADPTTADPTAGPTTVTTATTDDPDTTATATDGGESSTGVPPPSALAHYRLTVDNIWSAENHPGEIPADAHFSWFGGATHNDTWHLWALGEFSSPGMIQMQEIGPTAILLSEVEAAIQAGQAWSPLSWQHWFCPASTMMPECGPKVVEFDISIDFPLVTLVSMVGPSPDLFVGVNGMPLFNNGEWVESQVVELRPFDGGTRSEKDFELGGALQEPPLPISKIKSFEEHPLGPGVVGFMTFERLF